MICNYLFSNKYNIIILLLSVLVLCTSPALYAQYIDPPTAPKVIDEAVASETATEIEVHTETETNSVPADPGMQIPIDGSSLEAFEESLATIKESATEANYTTLEGAIQYLLVYDMGAGRDKAKLAKNLDGMTADEIISQVEWRNNR